MAASADATPALASMVPAGNAGSSTVAIRALVATTSPSSTEIEPIRPATVALTTLSARGGGATTPLTVTRSAIVAAMTGLARDRRGAGLVVVAAVVGLAVAGGGEQEQESC